MEKVVAVIMVGGPTKGTRFRPLSFNTPKPLFPFDWLASHWFIILFLLVKRCPIWLKYIFVDSMRSELSWKTTHFPLPSLLDAHKRYGGMGTMLVIKVSAESASQYGELVADPTTNEMLHYTEKPETFVSDLINCGVYIFSPLIFLLLSKMYLLTEKAEVVPAEVVEALLTSCKSVI
ncbi:uncharacterized protein LOC133314851 [Gastrolobium bilobum]|uniref:uncharacterized protein LOC133314851 n=1 Tax=Gastrolobium bilobum TaxID=150636 RepID=UPI002AB2FEF6|nr:uncharacterized protein LOC133314851 [Gastrolobium bilobum]XP_061372367.1 uncharacterized protein LOC133314851 [Gastrolobium bilobum]XP_061372368.1 uncharacterized protein LOC133314851 [Gastrolobium bilobum]XP_061372369.1 uncharacterized protein LOC133314851 [Gastrolobium bilobum]XP_061372370.1 uncharacterized protein LOC133314851 [Gastrolobium bilobum]